MKCMSVGTTRSAAARLCDVRVYKTTPTLRVVLTLCVVLTLGVVLTIHVVLTIRRVVLATVQIC